MSCPKVRPNFFAEVITMTGNKCTFFFDLGNRIHLILPGQPPSDVKTASEVGKNRPPTTLCSHFAAAVAVAVVVVVAVVVL